MRQPSGESVAAQPHLVLLKEKLRQRRLHREPSVGDPTPRHQADPVEYHSPPDPRLGNGRFERVASSEADSGRDRPSTAPSSGGLGRPREAPRANTAQRRDASPRGVAGHRWDPPASPHDEGALTPMKQAVSSARKPLERPSFGYPDDQEIPSSGAGQGFPSSGMAGMGPEDGGGGPLVDCPECGRSFNKDRLERHMKVCKKVFSQKRKQFNSAADRLGDLENAQQLIANAKKIEKEKEKMQSKKAAPGKSDGGTVPEWKKKSLAFRAAILAAKGDAGDESAAAEAMELQGQLDAAGGADSQMLKCPHCGRTFNKEAGERHVVICVKTFGSKPGGGRLMAGAGRHAVAGPTGGKKPGSDQAYAPPPRGSSATRARAEPAAATRRPSAHRSRGSVTPASQGAPAAPPSGRRSPLAGM